MMPLHERYRPQSFDDMVGNPKALARCRAMAQAGIGGSAIWISGPTAIGKTTAARILALSLADKFCVREIDAGSLTADQLREWQAEARQFGWGKGGRAFILNEAHGLRADIIRRLLVWIDELPEHVSIIFTTTLAGEDKLFEDHTDATPLVGRCHEITFTGQGTAEPIAQRVQRIAREAGLDGRPIEDYVKLVRKRKGNIRMALNDVEAGCMAAD